MLELNQTDIELKNRFTWECAERTDATPTSSFYSAVEDKFIWEINDYVLDHLEDKCPNAVEVARYYQIYLTEPVIPKDFDLVEYFTSQLDVDDEYHFPSGWEDAEKAINQWIKSVPVEKWPVEPSKIAWSGN